MRPVAATLGMPKPPLGPSSQPTIVCAPNVQRARVALFQSATDPQFALVRPTEYTTACPVTESAVTGAGVATCRPGVRSAPAEPVRARARVAVPKSKSRFTTE